MFEDSVALVTGGGSGIGRQLCEQLAARGAQVAIADLSQAAAEEVAQTIGGNARAYTCDVSDRPQLEAMARNLIRDFGRVNIVFAHAGVALAGKLIDTDPREFQWLFDVNVAGVFHTIQVFVPLLLESASKSQVAHFVVTGSENSVGVPLGSPSSVYTATKHAALALADTLRRDLSESGVGVSIFNPGLTNTRIWDARRARQERYGGASAMPAEFAARAAASVKEHGQDPALTAAIALEGIARGDFMIITDARIRQIAEPRSHAIATALDVCDARLSQEKN